MTKIDKEEGDINIGTTTPDHFITLSYTREDYKRQYSLRTRIGLRILWLIGVIQYEWKSTKEKDY